MSVVIASHGEVDVTCEDCQEVNSISLEGIEYEHVGGDEDERLHTGTCYWECSRCGASLEIKLTVHEEPRGVKSAVTVETVGCTVSPSAGNQIESNTFLEFR